MSNAADVKQWNTYHPVTSHMRRAGEPYMVFEPAQLINGEIMVLALEFNTRTVHQLNAAELVEDVRWNAAQSVANDWNRTFPVGTRIRSTVVKNADGTWRAGRTAAKAFVGGHDDAVYVHVQAGEGVCWKLSETTPTWD